MTATGAVTRTVTRIAIVTRAVTRAVTRIATVTRAVTRAVTRTSCCDGRDRHSRRGRAVTRRDLELQERHDRDPRRDPHRDPRRDRVATVTASIP